MANRGITLPSGIKKNIVLNQEKKEFSYYTAKDKEMAKDAD